MERGLNSLLMNQAKVDEIRKYVIFKCEFVYFITCFESVHHNAY